MKRLLLLILVLLITTSATRAQKTVADSMNSGGIIRHYNLYIPKNYVSGSHRPLIIHLHGYGSNEVIEQRYTNYMPVADTADFLVVYPRGVKDGSGNQYWNAGIIGFQNAYDDVAFLSALVDTLHKNYNIDRNRVYASGLSNGGYMCYQLAWKLANKISAIASVSGTMHPEEFAKCKPTMAVPVMEIHGTADQTVPYVGTSFSTDIDTLLHFWVLKDGCIPLPGVMNLPDIDPTDGSTVIHYQWTAELKNTACELYKIVGGGHIDWPGAGKGNNQDFSASPTIWQFFNRFQLSQLSIREKSSLSSINFYPNPCRSSIHITESAKGTITIMDVAGRIVIRTIEKEIDISGLRSGAYLLQFQHEGITIPIREKFLKY